MLESTRLADRENIQLELVYPIFNSDSFYSICLLGRFFFFGSAVDYIPFVPFYLFLLLIFFLIYSVFIYLSIYLSL